MFVLPKKHFLLDLPHRLFLGSAGCFNLDLILTSGSDVYNQIQPMVEWGVAAVWFLENNCLHRNKLTQKQLRIVKGNSLKCSCSIVQYMRGGKVIKAFRWKYCTIMDQKGLRQLAAVTQEGLPLQKMCAHRLEILPKKNKNS